MAAPRPRDPFSTLSASMRTVLLIGRETYLHTEGARRMAGLLREAFGDVDRIRFDGETAALADVLDELRSFALIRCHKLVIVDDAYKFVSGRGRGGGDEAGGDQDEEDGTAAGDPRRRRAMEAYAEHPSPEATLLLRSETWRPGKLDKVVAAHGAIVKCEPLRDPEAAAWCAARGSGEHGLAIDRAAAELLVERVGTGLGRLDGELAKLAAFLGDRKEITRADVEALVGPGRQDPAWALQSAMLSGSPAKAYRKMRELLEVARVDEVLVMWAVSDLLRRLHSVARLLERGESLAGHTGRLRLWGADGDHLIKAARQGKPALFARLLERAVSTDHRTKSGSGDERVNLEVLALEVTDTIGCL